MPVYAHEGEWVTCTNGHQITRFARSVRSGDPSDPRVLADWQQEPVKVGTPFDAIGCAKCGASFVKDHMIFHFSDGWRGVHSQNTAVKPVPQCFLASRFTRPTT